MGKQKNNIHLFLNAGKGIPLLFIVIFILVSLLITAIGYFNYYRIKQNLTENANDNLNAVVDLRAEQIANWRSEKIREARLIMRNTLSKSFFSNWLSGNRSENVTNEITFWLNSLIDSSEYTGARIYDSKERLIVSSGTDSDTNADIILLNKSYSSKSVILSDLHKVGNGRIILTLIIPSFMSGDSNAVAGGMAIDINPGYYLYKQLRNWPSPSMSSEITLVKKENENVVYLTNVKFVESSALNMKIPSDKTDYVSVQAIHGKTEYAEGLDYRGEEVVASIQPVAGSDWILISKIDKSELYKPLRELSLLLIIMIFSLMIAAGAVLAFLWRQRGAKYYKEMYNLVLEKNSKSEQIEIFMKNAYDNIFLFDKNGNVIDVNEKSLATYGYSREEILCLNAKDIRAPGYKDDVDAVMDKLKDSDGIMLETFHITKYGRIFPAEISAVSFKIGEEIYFQSFIRDISERKGNEEKLRLSEQKFRAVFENANDAMFLMDNETIIDANYSAENIFGITKGKLIGKKPFELSPAIQQNGIESKELASRHIELAYKGNPQFFEWCHRNADGVSFFTEVSLNLAEFEQKKFLVAVIRDITFRKYALDSLKEKEERLELALKGADLGYWDLNVQTGEIFSNARCYEMLGYSKEDVKETRKWWNDIKNPDDAEISTGVWARYLEGKIDVYQSEVRYKTKDGNWKWILDRGKVVGYDTKGNPLRAAGTHLDITERKITEEEYIKAKESAEEMSRLKSNFLAIMSHELRTPMTGIIGFAEILNSELRDPEQKEMAGLILKGGKRLTETLNSILDLSRIEANKLSINCSLVNVYDNVMDTARLFEYSAKAKGLFLNIESGGELLFAKLDERLFGQILNNLIQNAITYTNEGGITVKIGKILNGTGQGIEVRITDTGIGIAEENIETIFEPFRQVSEGLSRKFEGTGLGLTITKRFVEAMNGNIRVESIFCKGSDFIITFPSEQMDTRALKKEPVKEIQKEQNVFYIPSALIVEDEIDNIALIKAVLKSIIILEHVTDGYTAVERCKNNNYSIILMDIGLKGIDGLKTTKFIRQIPGYENTPIIALTAFAMEGDKDKFISEGCTDYISKPFELSNLISIVKKYTSE
ncbi:MAG: PAS domain S-box protein [Ignavibacteriae bacterium]|nr:PAS domain S-box protein [Ignavibacteriota bacterium]